jgi:hypothetical protein
MLKHQDCPQSVGDLSKHVVIEVPATYGDVVHFCAPIEHKLMLDESFELAEFHEVATHVQSYPQILWTKARLILITLIRVRKISAAQNLSKLKGINFA